MLFLAASVLSVDPAKAADRVLFRNVTAASGIDFVHTDGSGGRHYIVETVASGTASFDFDNDGLIDVYFLNGAPLPGTVADETPRNRLYKNLGGFRFRDVTNEAGVGDPGYGLGVAVGDYDADGWQDLYVSNYGPNVFYRNNGDGTFSDVTERTGTGLADPQKAGAGVCFLDADGDGRLDLYVANYLAFSPDMNVTASWKGLQIYPDPSRFRHWPDNLFRNNGDGTFTDVSEESGVNRHQGRGMGIVAADYDNDGDTDVLVLSDGPPGNSLLKNDGTGKFEDVGLLAGVAFDSAGLAHGAMGTDCGDFDNDGLLDFFVTSYQGQWATLYKNLGDDLFDDVTQQTGAGTASFNHVTWGCALVDVNNDGFKDIFYVRGHLIDNIELLDDTTALAAPPALLLNQGNGRFIDVSSEAGDAFQTKSVGRGAVFDDFDNDGRVDAIILNSRRPATVLRNESVNSNHWLQIRLVGKRANRDGVGSHVIVTAGDLRQLDEVHAGRGYQGHFGTRLHFGLGSHDRVDRLEIRWLGGGVDVLEDLPVDRRLTIEEGGKILADEPGTAR
ncbi:CRTAC1 family protein [Thermopirellula anaerolimosa]